MPELPEVEHIVRYLGPLLRGRLVEGVPVLDRPATARGRTRAALARELRGACAGAVRRLGKLIVIPLEATAGRPPRALLVHLKITGKLWALEPPVPPPGPATRLVIALDHGELRLDDQRRFAWLDVVDAEALAAAAARIGPDALLAPEAVVTAALRARRGRLKPMLLDQRVLAGVGNIYADEALYRARLHPEARAADVGGAALRRLARAVRDVLAVALSEREGIAVPDQERVGSGRRGVAARKLPHLQVYQRTGEPCPRCRTPIERSLVQGRATHLCPRCQPAPEAGA